MLQFIECRSALLLRSVSGVKVEFGAVLKRADLLECNAAGHYVMSGLDKTLRTRSRYSHKNYVCKIFDHTNSISDVNKKRSIVFVLYCVILQINGRESKKRTSVAG